MPAAPYIQDGQVSRLTVYCYCPGDAQAGLMTIHLRQDNHTAAGVTAAELAEAFYALVAPPLADCMSSSATVQGVICNVYQTATDRVEFSGRSADPATPGTVVQPMVPGQVAALLRKNTNLAGPAFRGRNYIPFLPVTFIVGAGALTAGALTALNTFRTTMGITNSYIGPGGTATATMVLAHHGTLPLTSTEVFSTSIALGVATQKRRGDFGHINAPFGG